MNKLPINTLLGIGGVISMIASPIIAYSSLNTALQVQQTKIEALQNMREVVQADHDLLIQIATKFNIDTSKATSVSVLN